MENGVEKNGVFMFRDEELRKFDGLKRGEDYIEVTCGCTSQRYGDAVGKLRVYLNGELLISCECTPRCQEDKLTPIEFEKHSGRDGARKWKHYVWVMVQGKRVSLSKSGLLKYYDQVPKTGKGFRKPHTGPHLHRDEFVLCTVCKKMRRFQLKNQEDCRIHHDAMLNNDWKCSDIHQMNCDHEEERASRRVYRGCSCLQTCKGCMTCVCFGCSICRFSDCTCQTCIDFIRNAQA
ncbi:Ultrapetala-like protein [Thalictrum thalictroides]|uniref:Ultrapetala-like protein n=1 Tax=Thalictrum thalictroides TaxID=46969 RepID=A0A7J6VUT4_THATH|nr:Ultrapetala-like protein [Thalictrum thalictroides]